MSTTNERILVINKELDDGAPFTIPFEAGTYIYLGRLINQSFTGLAITNFSAVSNVYVSLESVITGLAFDGTDPQGVFTLVPGQTRTIEAVKNWSRLSMRIAAGTGNIEAIVIRQA